MEMFKILFFDHANQITLNVTEKRTKEIEQINT